MVIAVTPDERHTFVLPAERELPEGQQTKFFLRTLTTRERLALDRSRIDSSGDRFIDFGDRCLETLRAGLTGWDNLVDANGAAVPYEQTGAELDVCGVRRRCISDASLNRLPGDVVTEVLREINRLTELTPEDVGN